MCKYPVLFFTSGWKVRFYGLLYCFLIYTSWLLLVKRRRKRGNVRSYTWKWCRKYRVYCQKGTFYLLQLFSYSCNWSFLFATFFHHLKGGLSTNKLTWNQFILSFALFINATELRVLAGLLATLFNRDSGGYVFLWILKFFSKLHQCLNYRHCFSDFIFTSNTFCSTGNIAALEATEVVINHF